jgi:hypothetical protein
MDVVTLLAKWSEQIGQCLPNLTGLGHKTGLAKLWKSHGDRGLMDVITLAGFWIKTVGLTIQFSKLTCIFYEIWKCLFITAGRFTKKKIQ